MLDRSNRANNRERNLLAKTSFMKHLSPAALESLLDSAQIISLPARSIIFREGESATAIYCLLAGYARLYRMGKDGRQADFRICTPGEVFAECLVFGGTHYPYSAQAAENVSLARLDAKDVRDLAERDPTVAKAMIAALSEHLIVTTETLVNDRLHTAPQRVADYLLERCPVDSGSASIRLPFQKNLLAGMLGLAPEALSRAFSSLKRAGVSVRGRVIQISDVKALREM
ncbi:Crp/Fnr family transcriptional regulator [Rhizobium helianthi]|uniref:Crp/Fnr family transcriptional regulator n=1 Tax=Rhizobium helianthi TaxID=1132695 RepID=A0ABW4M3J9_9HYPH